MSGEEASGRGNPENGAAKTERANRSGQACGMIAREIKTNDMRRTRLLYGFLIILLFWSCARQPVPTATYDRNHDGRIDEWVYRINKSEIKMAFDTNADGKPDIVKTYENGALTKIEQDRNFDGRTDLVEQFYHGKPSRITRDDNFDGKPEIVEIYRDGQLAMVEHDPDGCGAADSVDYYENGRLVRTERRLRKK